jgi:squalene-hopene/tetraprenyl-beta-curcumene cyclase
MMNSQKHNLVTAAWVLQVLLGLACVHAADPPKPQYSHGDITVPAFHADEPRRPTLSVPLAEDFLRQGALAWRGSKGCVSCHTTGLYLTVRPTLTPYLGQPLAEMREFFVDELRDNLAAKPIDLQKATRPAQIIYTAAGLAEWDAHVTRRLSPETKQALDQMLDVQLATGTWGSLDCWPPYESDAYHLATMAAMAVAAAPGWLAQAGDQEKEAVLKLKEFLRSTPPPHDYGRTLLLWAAARMPDLLTTSQRTELVEMLWRHQRADGGWSIRTFAAPEKWGGGNRAAKLRAEPEFAEPPSDGHQTGLALIVLREAGVSAKDQRIQRGVRWLKENQRESGRWWTRSLNTDTFHFITYSGTAFPLLALALCDELPKKAALIGSP